MSDYLYWELSLQTSELELYWWPLIFESTRRASFTFHKPVGYNHYGIYFSAQEMDQITSSFPSLWKKIYDQQDTPLVSFWFSLFPTFCIQASIDHPYSNTCQLTISFENSLLYEGESEKDRKKAIRAFLQCGASLYEMCHPEFIRLNWDEVFNYPSNLNLCAIQQKNISAMPLPISFHDKKLFWQPLTEIGQETFLITDPLPIYARGRWNYVSWMDEG